MWENNNSVSKNYFYSVFYQIISILTPFITTPYISRVLGAENIGKYSFSLAIVTYFCIFANLGSVTYGQISIAKYRSNREKLNYTFSIIVYSRMVTYLISIIIYVIYIFFIKQMDLLSFVLTINLFAQLIDLTWFFQGIENFKLIAVRNLIVKLSFIVMIFLFIHNKRDLLLYVVLIQVSEMIPNIFLMFDVRRYVKLINVKLIDILFSIKENFVYFIPTVANVIFSSLDKCMIGWITKSNLQNGYYEQSNKIYTMLLLFITALTTVLLPRLVKLWNNNNIMKIQSIIIKATTYISLILFPIAFGLFSIADSFIPLFLGEGFSECIILVRIFCVMLILTTYNSVISNLCMVARGYQNKLNNLLLVSSFINIIANTILISQFKAVGATIASVISEAFLLGLILYFNRNIISFDMIFLKIVKYIFFAFIMSIFVFFIGTFTCISILTKVILQIIIGGIIYVGLLFMSRDQVIYKLLEYIKK